MNSTIKEDALQIMRAAFDAVLPDAAPGAQRSAV